MASGSTGPSLIVSFALAAVICVFAALCYAEVSALIPLAGSLYTYAYMTMGEIWAWLIGWIMMAQYLILASVIAIGWSSYVVGFVTSIGIQLPATLIGPPGLNEGLINLPAMLVVILLTAFLARGMRACNRVNSIMVFTKVIAIILFILVGLNFINPQNYIPFLQQSEV
jgi:APA family basic amino acid/polyamine antiporter